MDRGHCGRWCKCPTLNMRSPSSSAGTMQAASPPQPLPPAGSPRLLAHALCAAASLAGRHTPAPMSPAPCKEPAHMRRCLFEQPCFPEGSHASQHDHAPPSIHEDVVSSRMHQCPVECMKHHYRGRGRVHHLIVVCVVPQAGLCTEQPQPAGARPAPAVPRCPRVHAPPPCHRARSGSLPAAPLVEAQLVVRAAAYVAAGGAARRAPLLLLGYAVARPCAWPPPAMGPCSDG